jgi:hypothetical protein
MTSYDNVANVTPLSQMSHSRLEMSPEWDRKGFGQFLLPKKSSKRVGKKCSRLAAMPSVILTSLVLVCLFSHALCFLYTQKRVFFSLVEILSPEEMNRRG